jgi:hypothetical protein
MGGHLDVHQDGIGGWRRNLTISGRAWATTFSKGAKAKCCARAQGRRRTCRLLDTHASRIYPAELPCKTTPRGKVYLEDGELPRGVNLTMGAKNNPSGAIGWVRKMRLLWRVAPGSQNACDLRRGRPEMRVFAPNRRPKCVHLRQIVARIAFASPNRRPKCACVPRNACVFASPQSSPEMHAFLRPEIVARIVCSFSSAIAARIASPSLSPELRAIAAQSSPEMRAIAAQSSPPGPKMPLYAPL